MAVQGTPSSRSTFIKDSALRLGFDLVGITPAGKALHGDVFAAWVEAGCAAGMGYMSRDVACRQDSTRWLPGAKSVVVVGLSYDEGEPPGGLWNDPSRGRIARYAWGNDYHESMKPALDGLAECIRDVCGGEAVPRVTVDTAPVLERDLASAAGLGFVGRNTCLIHPVLGSYIFLAEVFVGVDLAYDGPADEDGATLTWVEENAVRGSSRARPKRAGLIRGSCGDCRRCIEACPTGALTAPYRLDAGRCIAYQTIENKGSIAHELRPALGNWIFGCDVCQMVCPWTRRSARTRNPVIFQGSADQCAPNLIDLMALTDAGFEARFRGTPVWRAKRQGLLRNVAVALGNWGDCAAIPSLERACCDEGPLVREHAEWALSRIRRNRT